MVFADKDMNSDQKGRNGRRVSSPISIPTSKLAHLQILAQSHQDHQDNSPISSPGNYPTPPQQSSSVPVPVRYMHFQRTSQLGNTEDTITEVMEHLPDCSPAFNAVLSELTGSDDSQSSHEHDSDSSSSIPPSEADLGSVQSTPNLPRRKKELRFNLDEEFEKTRSRSSIHALCRKPKRNYEPSSTQSTPTISRRTKKSVRLVRPTNVIPRYKFVTETIAVSHEDIVKEQQKQSQFGSDIGSPKSIFSLAEGR